MPLTVKSQYYGSISLSRCNDSIHLAGTHLVHRLTPAELIVCLALRARQWHYNRHLVDKIYSVQRNTAPIGYPTAA